MKKLILGMALILGVAFSANAQSATKKSDSKSKTETVQLKDHALSLMEKKATHAPQRVRRWRLLKRAK
jgi:hypothetical protein